jgi:4,5-DOPA dioxygenase extradiol
VGGAGPRPIGAWTGLDHGTWSVLAHLYPAADVPVVQLSINATKPLEHHLDLAARLAPLRERGVLIVGSGNVVHNLGRIDWKQRDSGFDWARRFDEAVQSQLDEDPAAILRLASHPDHDLAVPTPDHYVPMLYVAGLAAAAGVKALPLVQGCALGSLSMTCYGVGVDRSTCAQGVLGTSPRPRAQP